MPTTENDIGYSLSFGAAATAEVRALLDGAVRPHLQDVRAMLRLPLPEIGITAGCNFAAVHVLLNLLSGLSRLMGPGPGRSGDHFVDFVRRRYPWHLEPNTGLSRRRGPEALYGRFRNGFSHDLGLSLSTVITRVEAPNRPRRIRQHFKVRPPRIAVSKRPSLSGVMLQELDRVAVRPDWLPPTVMEDEHHASVVDAVALYWGVRRLIFDHTDTALGVRSLKQW
jgi:hypothetical protein